MSDPETRLREAEAELAEAMERADRTESEAEALDERADTAAAERAAHLEELGESEPATDEG